MDGIQTKDMVARVAVEFSCWWFCQALLQIGGIKTISEVRFNDQDECNGRSSSHCGGNGNTNEAAMID